MVEITKKSKVKFFPLFTKKEESEYIVGRSDTEVFIGMPEIGEDAIKLLKQGKTIEQTEQLLKKQFGDQDILSFAKTLHQEGFIKFIDGIPVKDKHHKMHHIMNWIDKKHISFLFSRPAYLLYLILIMSGLVIMLTFRQYLPRFDDVFFHDSLTVVYIGTFVLGWSLVFMHEMFHFFGARSLGVPASFSISNRLVFLVAETDMTDIYEVPPKRRYRAYLAGMLFDALVFATAILLLYLNDLRILIISNLAYRILKMVVLAQALGFIWQFLFFMKTDIYYVVSNYFRTDNLYKDTKKFLLNIWHRVIRKSTHHLDENPEGMKVVKIYSGLWIAGTFITLLRFFIYQLPITIGFFTKAMTKIIHPLTPSDRVDGGVFAILTLFDYGMLLYAMHLHHRRQRKKYHIGHILYHLFHHNKHRQRH